MRAGVELGGARRHHGSMILALLSLCVLSGAGPDPGGGDAPHDVGFRSTWILDHGRRYRTTFDDGTTYGRSRAPRPVLLNAWYPARTEGGARRMTHGDYFEIVPDDEVLAPLAEALREYALNVLVEETLGLPRAELGTDEQGLLEALLMEATGAVRDAPGLPGPFPLVIHHSGAGSSFEDDARLCELIASRGYVVLASAFLQEDGSGLGVDGAEGSVADLEFLVRHAVEHLPVDGGRIAAVGHSLGAQALLRWAARPDCIASALVLLDTTQDYYSLDMPLHRELVREVLARAADVDQALLAASGPEASFSLLDQLARADRVYLTLPELDHDEYIAQGMQRLDVLARSPAGMSEQELARASRARERHALLEQVVLAFLDARLLDTGHALESFVERLEATRWADDIHVQTAPPGVTGPRSYDPDKNRLPPTPRQVRALLSELGPATTANVLERWHTELPDSPLYESTMLAGSWLFTVKREAGGDDARSFFERLTTLHGAPLSLFLSFGALFERSRPELALELLETAAFYRPEDEELAARVHRLRAQVESPR